MPVSEGQSAERDHGHGGEGSDGHGGEGSDGHGAGCERAALYYSHRQCLEHDPRAHMPEHPDTPERLLAIERALAARDWLGWERHEAPPSVRGPTGANSRRQPR